MDYKHKGKRVLLIKMDDELSNLEPGDGGTIISEDDIGNIYVRWDNGSGLSLVPGEDEYRIIGESKKFKHLKSFINK